ncbi:sigma-70 family RNA polymerase sigma factor [archaeon]|nr:MAG: sigma-70 family RNA polymerase sigma factor [archaeon]
MYVVMKVTSKHNLLSFADEVELSRRYKVYSFIKRKERTLQTERGTSTSIPLSELATILQVSEDKLKHLVWHGEMARKILIRTNMRLVFHIARQYMRRGVTYSDLVQEGTLGLIKAVDKYDGEKGYRFSTYASWWIKQSISRSVAEKSRVVRLPVHIHDLVLSALRFERKFKEDYSRPPTNDELAQCMEIPERKLHAILKLAKEVQSTDFRLYSKSSKDGTAFFTKDRLMSEVTDPRDLDSVRYVRKELQKAMVVLTERENEVLSMRMGLNSGTPMTLDEVGKAHKVTRERIRQIEARAMKKLTDSPQGGKIQEMFQQLPDMDTSLSTVPSTVLQSVARRQLR